MKKIIVSAIIAALFIAPAAQKAFADHDETNVGVSAQTTIHTDVVKTNTTATVSGDINKDGVVNVDDMLIVINSWGVCQTAVMGVDRSTNDRGTSCRADLNHDGEVGQADLDIVLKNWTKKPVRNPNKNPDLNSDGIVGQADLKIVLAAFGPCMNKSLPPNCPEDLNSDSIIGKADVAILLAAWTDKEKPQLSPSETGRVRSVINVKPDDTDSQTRQDQSNRRMLVERYIKNIIERFNAAVVRLEQLTQRIEHRIEKYKQENINTTAAEKFVAQAKVEIREAKTNIAAIETALKEMTNAATTSTEKTTRDSYTKIRTLISAAKEDLKAAHRNLVQAISSLKPGANRIETNTNINTSTQLN